MCAVGRQPQAAPLRRHPILRLVGIVAAIVAVLLVAALISLHTPPARRLVLARITESLAASNIQVSADQLRYNLLDLSLTLRNVQIRSPQTPAAPPLAVIDSARLDLSLLQLLRGRYVVETGAIDGIRIHGFVDEQGVDNVPRMPTNPDQPSEPIDYLIADLDVTNAHVRYEDRARQIDLTLPVSSLEVDGSDLTNRHRVWVEAAAGTLRTQDRTTALDRLAGELDLGMDDVTIEQIDLAAAGSTLTLKGNVRAFEHPQGDLTVRAHLDTSRVAPLAGVTDAVGGMLIIDATAKGDLSTPELRARVTGSELAFRNVRQVQLAATGGYDMTQKRVDVSTLDVRAPWGHVAGDGSLALDGAGRSRVTADVTALDAATLMRAFDTPYMAATRVDGRVEAEWPGLDYLKARGDADVVLTPTVQRVSRSVLPVGGRIVVSAREGQIAARLDDVTAASAAVSGRIVLNNERTLEGAVQGRMANVARAVSNVEVLLGRPQGSLMPTPVGGTVVVDARLGGTVQSPTVTAAVSAPALTAGDASGIAITGDLAYTSTALNIQRLDLAWEQGRAHAMGRVGLAGARRLDVTLAADQFEVADLLRALKTSVPASGTVSLQGTVAGTVANPAVALTMQGANLAVYGETLGSLGARATVADRQARVSEVVLDKPQPGGNGRLTATGTFHLDRKSYVFEVGSDNLRLITATLPGGQALRGALEVAARGQGTVNNPSADIDLTVADMVFDTYELGRVTLNGIVSNQQATVTAAADRFRLDARALIGVERPYPASMKVQVSALDLAALPLDLQTPLDGQLRATVDAVGDLSEPAKGRATANVEAFAGSWNGQPFSVDAPAVVRYADERLDIDRLRVTAQDSILEVSGALPLTARAGEGVLKVDARANLATLTQYAPAGTNLTGTGALAVTGSLRGTLERIDPNLVVTVDNASLMTPQLEPGITNLQARVQVAEGEANVEQLAANWAAATLKASGRIPLDVLPALPVGVPRRGGPATVVASIDGLDVATLPGAPAGLTGRISLDAEIAADNADLAAIEGRIMFPDLELAFNGLTLAQQAPSRIAIAGGSADVQQLSLNGTAGSLTATGSVGMTGARALNVDVNGTLNIAAVSLFTDAVRADGASTLKVSARGTVDAPELNGFVDIADATLVVDDPTIAAERIAAHVNLAGKRISLTSLTADVNGGTLNGSGALTLGNGGVSDLDLQLSTSDFAFDAPLDLQSLSDSTIRIARREDEFVVDGQITIEEAGLTGDINFDTGLLAAMTARRRLDLTEKRNPLLERVRFNLDVDTATPILVDNNLARAEVSADVRVVGTPYETGLSGKLTVLEGGEITLNERRYEVERGVITFLDDRRIFPSFDLLMNTSAGNYDIAIAVAGTPGETETTLTADPELPEPDIMAMLVTGRTLDEMRGEEFEVAREQVLSYLSGRVGSTLGRGIERATGLSEVRIEPNLIAHEADPGARLTVGQEITDDLGLVYSTNLANSNDQIWIAEYDVTRRFQTRTVRQSDNSYLVDFRHDVRLGGRPAPRRIARQRPTITSVAIAGSEAISSAELHDRLGIDEGDKFDFFAVREGVQRIEAFYSERGWLQSRVRMERQVDGGVVNLTLRVTEGPLVDLQFEGITPPEDLRKEVAAEWHRGVFDVQRADDGVEAIRGWLMRDSHLQPRIEYAIEDPDPGRRRVVFRVEPGPRFDKVLLVFRGASAVASSELDDIIDEQGLEGQLFTDPVVVTELLERFYREQGYQAAAVDPPHYEFEGTVARVVLDVREGPLFTVRQVTSSGNAVIPTEILLPQLPVVPGDPFLPAAAENALERIRQLYWSRGYNDVRSDFQLGVDSESGHVDVEFTIAEGRQSVIADITIDGREKTSEHLVREQLELQPAQPLDLGALSRSRRNLYDTGAFSIVDITHQEVESNASEKPVRVNVAVREVQPVQLLYGASFDTERGPGGTFDISNHNSLGKARVVGLRSRYDAQVREVRGYLSQPSLRYWPVQTTGTLFYREERNPATNVADAFNVDRTGISIQSEVELRDSYLWSLGYRYERARTFSPLPGGLLDRTLAVSPLTMAFTREARDEALDATTGSFLSQAFAYSPSWLGSDLSYVKYFGQYFHYFPLQAPRRERFTNEILRPRLVYAVGVRLGLARGIGGDVPSSERFFAGGSTSIRGFEQNAVGDIGPDRIPLGGDALLVLNNELRFPLVSIVDGVAFLDVGNVFARIADFDVTNLRESAGIGVRVRTPWFLLRGDYGFVLDHRPGERRGRFYFSIGQAF